jgi:hypothetical protein
VKRGKGVLHDLNPGPELANLGIIEENCGGADLMALAYQFLALGRLRGA